MDGSGVRQQLRVAIVGCGAVTEKLHLPALAGSSVIHVTALVDLDAPRLTAFAARLRPGVYTACSTTGLERYADMAIVAVPNHLHVPIATDLLERGLHVFVEKPLAVSMDETRRLIEVAERVGRKLGVGLIRRHYLSFDFVQRVLDAGWLGRIQSFDLREGISSGWPVYTLSLFRRDHGGGVLLDVGAHALDMLLAWLGPFNRVKYRDDARGQVEANCLLELELRNGASGIVELSRTRNLRNTCIIRGERGELEVGVYPDSAVTLRLQSLQVGGAPTDGRTNDVGLHAAARRQLETFANSICAGSEPRVPASEALESVRLFDACRSSRQALDLAWEPFKADIDWSKFAGKRVLVLGGAGFIGSRVVEALAQNSTASIRVLARNLSRVAGIARYPVEIMRGDVGDRQALQTTVQDCDYVINCTYGKGARAEQVRVNVDAVRSLIQIARANGVRQVVHTSTMTVYGAAKDGVLDEHAGSRAPRGDAYGYTKWKGESVALSEGRRLGVPVVVIQPTAVYGPGAPSWTVIPLGIMKSARMVLVNGGVGISNAVYVDDVATALLKAALEPRAAGERMLVSGPDVVTWRDFFGAYDDLLGGGRTLSMDPDDIERARRAENAQRGNLVQLWALLRDERQARYRLLALPAVSAIRSVFRTVLPAAIVERIKMRTIAPAGPALKAAASRETIRLPSRAEEKFFRAVVAVDCSKAATLIGYTPRYPFNSGMRLVSEWANWAGVL